MTPINWINARQYEAEITDEHGRLIFVRASRPDGKAEWSAEAVFADAPPRVQPLFAKGKTRDLAGAEAVRRLLRDYPPGSF